MNAKSLLGAVVIAVCWAGAARAQPPATVGTVEPAPAPLAAPAAPVSGPTIATPPTPELVPQTLGGLSDWILYRRPQCCSTGPINPLFSELFLRVGPSVPLGGNYLGRELQTGWTIEGGARGLLFDTAMTSAWVAEAHIVNTNHSGGGGQDPVVLNIFQPTGTGTSARTNVPVTVRNSNRTLVGLGAGREWYLWQPANAPGNKWRVGVDGGGRYGSGSMTFNEIKHRTDVMGGVWAAAHTDYEIPCRCCVLQFGARCEWAYTRSDILQKQSDTQELNLLVNFGVRY
jgi:hypothetical protein